MTVLALGLISWIAWTVWTSLGTPEPKKVPVRVRTDDRRRRR